MAPMGGTGRAASTGGHEATLERASTWNVAAGGPWFS